MGCSVVWWGVVEYFGRVFMGCGILWWVPQCSRELQGVAEYTGVWLSMNACVREWWGVEE